MAFNYQDIEKLSKEGDKGALLNSVPKEAKEDSKSPVSVIGGIPIPTSIPSSWISNLPDGWAGKLMGDAGDAIKEAGSALVSDVASSVNPVVQGAYRAFDSDYSKNTEPKKPAVDLALTSTPDQVKVRENILKQKSEMVSENQIAMADNILSMRDRGVSKKDALDFLAKQQGTMVPQEYARLQAQLNSMYPAETPTGPVDDDQINDLKLRNKNKSEGKGGATGKVTPETDKPKSASLEEEGALGGAASRVVSEEETSRPWHQSPAFFAAMLRFGLGMASGEDWETAVGHAAGGYKDVYDKTKRQDMMEELLADGYSKASIMQWAQTGDESDLYRDDRFTQDSDDLGYYQVNSYTGKKEYLRYHDDIAYKKAQAAKANSESKGGGKFSEGDKTAYNYYNRAHLADRNLTNFYKSNPSYFEDNKGFMSGMQDAAIRAAVLKGGQIPEHIAGFVDPKLVELINIERNLVTPLLRRESGAAISESEWKTYGSQLFPRVNDSPEELERKRRYRQITVQGLKAGYDLEMKHAIEGLNSGVYKDMQTDPETGRVIVQDYEGNLFFV